MKRSILTIFAILVTACGTGVDFGKNYDAPMGELFRNHGVEGTFYLRRESDGKEIVYNRQRAGEGFLPASTFKIFNSLLSLDLKVIGVDDAIPWDGVVREYVSWNQDQRMREAFQRSTVWFYQILARRIGEKRMREALVREDYGNRNPGGGIDTFWLSGDLRISARQQADFLQRLHRRTLGFSPETMETVESLMLWEECPSHILRGKSGWTQYDGKQLGWMVGWMERRGEIYYYAMNLESPRKDYPMIKERKAILFAALKETGLLEESCPQIPKK